MKTHNLNVKLRKVVDDYITNTSNIPSINSGGCGIFAANLYRVLVKLGYDARIIVLTNLVDKMNERINGKKFSLTLPDSKYPYIDHIVIQVEDLYFDCDGMYIDALDTACGRTGKYLVEMPIEVLDKWNNDEKTWNNTFNRHNIKVIQKELEKTYKKFAKNLEVSNI